MPERTKHKLAAFLLENVMNANKLLVTGASGALGRKVLDQLLASGAGPLLATTRNPDSLRDYAARGVEVRAADFDDEAQLVSAFRGASRALLISTDALDQPGRRLRQHLAAIRALKAAGAGHLVYTSVTNPSPASLISIAADHRQTEAAIFDSGLGYTILRNNLYADLLLHALPAAVASGQLIDARGRGAVGFVSRDDVARAAMAALAFDRGGSRVFEVTGPEAVTSAQVAAIASEIAGRKIVHLPVSPEALVEGLRQHGLPEPIALMLASFDRAIAAGELGLVSTAIETLSARRPQTLRAFLQQNAAGLASH